MLGRNHLHDSRKARPQRLCGLDRGFDFSLRLLVHADSFGDGSCRRFRIVWNRVETRRRPVSARNSGLGMADGFRDTEFDTRHIMPFECFEEALRDCVRGCGGTKVVGHLLRPEIGVEAAQRWLLACLNDERPEKLGTDHLLLLLRTAHDHGCHTGMNFLAHTLGYARPAPVAPADEHAELQRQFLKQAEHMQRTADRIFEMSQAAPKLRGVA